MGDRARVSESRFLRMFPKIPNFNILQRFSDFAVTLFGPIGCRHKKSQVGSASRNIF